MTPSQHLLRRSWMDFQQSRQQRLKRHWRLKRRLNLIRCHINKQICYVSCPKSLANWIGLLLIFHIRKTVQLFGSNLSILALGRRSCWRSGNAKEASENAPRSGRGQRWHFRPWEHCRRSQWGWQTGVNTAWKINLYKRLNKSLYLNCRTVVIRLSTPKRVQNHIHLYFVILLE